MGLSLSFRNILLGDVLEPCLSLIPSASQFPTPLSYIFQWFFLAVLTFHAFPYFSIFETSARGLPYGSRSTGVPDVNMKAKSPYAPPRLKPSSACLHRIHIDC